MPTCGPSAAARLSLNSAAHILLETNSHLVTMSQGPQARTAIPSPLHRPTPLPKSSPHPTRYACMHVPYQTNKVVRVSPRNKKKEDDGGWMRVMLLVLSYIPPIRRPRPQAPFEFFERRVRAKPNLQQNLSCVFFRSPHGVQLHIAGSLETKSQK